MRAARLHAYGPPSGVVVEDIPAPRPRTGQALVRVHAAAVNFPDVLIAADRYQVSVPPPYTLGSEFAGTLVALGPDTDGPPIGSAVMGGASTGAFAEELVAPVRALRPVPVGMDMISAAAFRVGYTTAYHALVSIGSAVAGDWVTVLGAAGGVGSAAVDVGTRLGMRVVAVASSAERLAVATGLGAVAGVDYGREDLKERLKEITEGGSAVVVDPVGGDQSESALRAMRWGGRFVTVGYADGRIPRIPLNLVLLKGLVVRGFELRTIGEHLPGASTLADAALAELVASGMRPRVSSVRPLSEVALALAEVAGRTAMGKVVLDMGAR